MKKYLILCLIVSAILLTGCSMEDFGFVSTSGTGLTITRAKYNQINYGYNYSQVKAILGGECINYYSNDEEDWYTCADDRNPTTRIVLKFQNGKLVSKSSSGLN